MSSAPPASAGSARPAGSGSGAAASSGAQQHRRNSQRGGRNRNAASGSTPHTAGLKPTTTRFVGKEEGLGAFVYQALAGSDASNQYTKTTEEIIRYATTKFTHGCDVEQSLTDGVLLDFPLPVAPATIPPALAPDAGELMLWKMEAQMVLAKRQTLQDNMKGAYALILGQCSEANTIRTGSYPKQPFP